MPAEPLDLSWIWTLTTQDSVLHALVRPREPAGWELCVLQDNDLVLSESFLGEAQARDNAEALRKRLQPALGAAPVPRRRAG
jgi:hypothetical protein